MCDAVAFPSILSSMGAGGASASTVNMVATMGNAVGSMGMGGLVTMGSTLMTAKANSDMAKYQADVATMQAEDAIARGQLEEDRARRRAASFKGTQRSQLAASGVELDSGSASDLQADTAMLSELDALTIRNNAEREAWAYEARAGMADAKASNIMTTGFFNAAGQAIDAFDVGPSILGGEGYEPVADRWYEPDSVMYSDWNPF